MLLHRTVLQLYSQMPMQTGLYKKSKKPWKYSAHQKIKIWTTFERKYPFNKSFLNRPFFSFSPGADLAVMTWGHVLTKYFLSYIHLHHWYSIRVSKLYFFGYFIFAVSILARKLSTGRKFYIRVLLGCKRLFAQGLKVRYFFPWYDWLDFSMIKIQIFTRA